MTPATHARLQGTDDEKWRRALLQTTLLALVPLWIERVRRWSPEQRCASASEAASIISVGSKVDETRGRHGQAPACFAIGHPIPEDERGETLNSMAMGLAILAYLPGGVTFLDLHWEAA